MRFKRLISIVLCIALALSAPMLYTYADENPAPVLKYTFEDTENAPSLFGNAALVYDSEKGGNVLSLDGSSGTYAEIPQGFFDGRDVMTVAFDVYTDSNSGNYFTFTFGQNNERYNFFRIRDNEIRNAITVNSWTNEREVICLGSDTSKWMNIAIVIDNTDMKLYVDGILASENTDTGITVSQLGSNLLSYIGKSLYDGDGYFNGKFDNFEVYDCVLNKYKDSPDLQYTFEDNTTLPTLYGNAQTVYDSERKSKVLYLDGSSGAYAEIPQGTFDNRDVMTLVFDVKAVSNSGNYFTLAFGKDTTYYDFFRIRGSEVRNAITAGSYWSEHEVKSTVDFSDSWMSIAIVFNGTSQKLYINGNLAAENTDSLSVSALGTDLLSYIGKSFYDGDGYFSGYFDNIEVYPNIISDTVIKEKAMLYSPLLIGATVGKTENIDGVSGTDGHTAVRTTVNRSNGEINSIIQRRQSIKAVPVKFSVLNEDCTVLVDGNDFGTCPYLDLTYDRSIVVRCGDKEESYTLKTPSIANNPVLPGMYADPDVDVLDGKFWIFPTTDGTIGWGGTQFRAFSSRDMVHWCDEGIILDNKDKAPSLNEKGVQIASSAWSDGNAWAPAIEEKNGKYYFYYCGRILDSLKSTYGEGMAIGVAWADSPAGPYTASDTPILYPKMLSDANIGFEGQVIDPSIYTEGNTSYILFGNGSAAMATLSSDMKSASSLRLITGLTDFRESIAVFKRDNYYYFTWSCDDTGSENYHINYGTASSLTGKITNQGTILQKDTDNGILATGHQSVVQAGSHFFIAYHRFYTPLSVGGNVGHRRETCIEEITFSSKWFSADTINTITPTYTGVGPIDTNGNSIEENITYPTCESDGSITGGITLTSDEAPEIKALGHHYIKGAATYKNDGYEEYTCTVCNNTYRDYFESHLNCRTDENGYTAELDKNGDGIINAKDYAYIIKETGND